MVEPILKPIKHPGDYSHRVGKRDEVYVAGATDVKFCTTAHLLGGLFLERIVEQKPVKLWTPSLLHPFRSATKTEEVKECEFRGLFVLLTPDSFDDFYKELNGQLLGEYSSRIEFEDAKLFFEKVYNHYSEFYKSLRKSFMNVSIGRNIAPIIFKNRILSE